MPYSSPPQVVGSSGGVLSGGLTVAGGVVTILSGGAAAPILIAAGAGIGLASGITGAGASVSRTIIKSKQMKKVQQAIDEDAATTEELEIELEKVATDRRKRKIADHVLTAGFLADDGLNVVKFITGTKDLSGHGIIHGLEAVSSVLGETVNKEIMKVVAHTGGHVLSGVVHGVIGGALMVFDMYHLKKGIQALADGSEEGAQQIREIADQLELGLDQVRGGQLPQPQAERDSEMCDDDRL